jgi:hypothetical protein
MRFILIVMPMRLFLRTLILTGGLSLVLAGPPPDITEPVRVLRAVGPEGQGNAAASVAWKKLAAGNAATLGPLLVAMEGANDYALNWLRAARCRGRRIFALEAFDRGVTLLA